MIIQIVCPGFEIRGGGRERGIDPGTDEAARLSRPLLHQYGGPVFILLLI